MNIESKLIMIRPNKIISAVSSVTRPTLIFQRQIADPITFYCFFSVIFLKMTFLSSCQEFLKIQYQLSVFSSI